MEAIRPVESFPHLPIIPIDKGALQRYEEAKMRRKEKMMQFHLDRQKLWGGFLFATSTVMVIILIRLVMLAEENMMYDYEQVKLRRYGQMERTMLEQDYRTENRGRRDSPLKQLMADEERRQAGV